MRTTILLLAALGCGDKAPPTASPAPAETPVTAAIPDTAAAKGFARALTHVVVTDWRPTGGPSFAYHTLSFAPDGTFTGVAVVTVQDESVDCRETGRWQIDDCTDSSAAIMTWHLATTNCPSRTAGSDQRVKMSVKGSQYNIELH